MKKTLIAVAALAATGAFAQVSVYGRLDAGYAMTTATTDNTDVKANGVNSHNSVSSMWGIQGSEDLGGGMKANFKLEQDLYTANGNTGASGAGGGGTNAAGFNRTSLVGVSGAFGSVAFGRDYVPSFKVVAATDINSLSRVSTVQLAAAGGQSTAPNLIHYSTPVMSGFQVNLAYGNTDTSSSSQTGETSTKITNLSATYSNGPLYVGFGTGTTEGKSNGASSTGSTIALGTAVVSLGAQADKVTGTVLAAGYDFGKVAVKGNVITNKATTASSDGTATEVNVGVTVPLGKVLLKAQVGSNKITATGLTEDRTGTDAVLGADYSLSAKTAVFLTTGTFGKTSGSGVDNKVTSTAIGVKTVF